jgi:UDP-N-acetylglucosamine 2-epimerase (non-hydrolysing)
MKIDVVLGTRPELIKLAPVIRELKSIRSDILVSITLTGQHKDIINDFLEWFEITPNINLEIANNSNDLVRMCAENFVKYNDYIQQNKFDGIIVQGDTSSGLFSSLSAFYNKIPIFHVEAGLRSHNNVSPFPEEMNRKIISQISDLHFCPTQLNKDNLLREGIKPDQIFVTGNTVVDALKFTLDKNMTLDFESRLQPHSDFVLITLHRRESWGESLNEILTGIQDSAKANPEFVYVFIMHANRALKKIVESHLSGFPNIKLYDPTDYQNMISLISASSFILTDSGGIQEEGVALSKKVLVARDETDRPEGVQAGYASLIGRKTLSIRDALNEAIANKEFESHLNKIYGDGDSAIKISNEIIKFLENSIEV